MDREQYMNREFYRRKKTARNVSFEKVERLKLLFKYNDDEIGMLLAGVSAQQVRNYRKCGLLPASRWVAMRDALLIRIEEDARKMRNIILSE
jgi:hypothetical protein